MVHDSTHADASQSTRRHSRLAGYAVRWSLLAQAAGLVSIVVGFTMLAGLGYGLIVGGGLVAMLGTLREAGRI